MANSKRRCTYCKKYKPFREMVIVPIGAFCNDNHRYLYGIEHTDKLLKKSKQITKKKHITIKREFKANDVKLRKKMAQAAFNKYVRCRDEKLPCISCGRFHKGQYHAGHYKTTGAHSELRFNEDNCHKQCSPCNLHLSGNIEHYRPNLIEKIGESRFIRLESAHTPIKFTCLQLKAIENYYKKKLNVLQSTVV